MSAPRKHHLVAQLYQRGFARNRGSQWQARVLDRTGQGGVRNVRDIFARRDWNTIEDADGTKIFDVEQILADEIDAPAAPVLNALREDNRFPLDEAQREALAMFVSAQLTRGRVIRENLAESVTEVNRHILKLVATNYTDAHWFEATGEIPSPEVRHSIFNSEEHFEIKPTNALLLDTLLGSVTEVAELIATRTWTLVCFDTPYLFTAENPVIHINPSGQSTGFGVLTAERLYMPISTTQGLVLSHPWTSWPEAVVHGTDELARRLNWAMLVYPNNREMLLHPDVPRHPLPGAALLAADGYWPWGEDPESKPPVFMHYVA